MTPKHRDMLIALMICASIAGLTGCSKGAADSAAAAAPDEAVLRVAQGIADGHPEVAWHSLPPSYRQDVTGLVHDAASKMDVEVWNQSFAVLQKLTRLARDKRDFILDNPMVAQNLTDRKEAEAGWGAMVNIFDVLIASDLADLDKLKRLDVEHFLADTGGDLMEQISAAASLAPDDNWAEQMADLRRTKAKIVSESGDSAVVRVERPGKAPAEEPYVRVEGYWVPQEMADGWDAKIAEARTQIDQMSAGYLDENKQMVLMQLNMLDGALDTLLRAQTAEQFNAGLGPLMGMAMGAAMAQAQSGGAEAVPITGAGPVLGMPGEPTVVSDYQATEEPEGLTGVDTAVLDRNLASPRAPLPGTRYQREITDEGGAEIHSPEEIAISEAHRYIGQPLRVVTDEGLDSICRLKEIRDETLVFERNLYGGSVSIEVGVDEIELLQLVTH